MASSHRVSRALDEASQACAAFKVAHYLLRARGPEAYREVAWRGVEKPLSFAARCQMRVLAALVLSSITALPAIARSAVRADDDAAIREVVRKYVDAREKRDPSLIAALFTEDADQITTSGEWRRGRDN